MGQNKVGLSFSLPIYQGGMVNSQVKQAQYNFVGASEQLESAHRSVVQTVRSSFNNINASISSINAYKQARKFWLQRIRRDGSGLLGWYAYHC